MRPYNKIPAAPNTLQNKNIWRNIAGGYVGAGSARPKQPICIKGTAGINIFYPKIV